MDIPFFIFINSILLNANGTLPSDSTKEKTLTSVVGSLVGVIVVIVSLAGIIYKLLREEPKNEVPKAINELKVELEKIPLDELNQNIEDVKKIESSFK